MTYGDENKCWQGTPVFTAPRGCQKYCATTPSKPMPTHTATLKTRFLIALAKEEITDDVRCLEVILIFCVAIQKEPSTNPTININSQPMMPRHSNSSDSTSLHSNKELPQRQALAAPTKAVMSITYCRSWMVMVRCALAEGANLKASFESLESPETSDALFLKEIVL